MIQSGIYDNIVEKIQSAYSSCSASEQRQLIQILREISITGDSETLERLWLADFKEIPVSIDTFICDPYYLGQTNRNGEGVYPFWKQTVRDIFGSGNQYYEIVLSGATRVGKTSTMTLIMAYMLYRLMLYRNPHEYFKKKEVSRFTIGFANLTQELAAGVAYREFNDTLKEVPWFMDHGSVSRSQRNFYYIPEGDKINIVCGSDASNFLGMQLWACLTGQTKIVTPQGIKTLQECEGTYQDVYSVLDDGSIQVCNAPVVRTKEVTELIRITLEDGSVIEGTPDHRVMLSNGQYKALGKLSSSDDLLTLNECTEVDDMNFASNNFLVYEHVSPDGKRYIGMTGKSAQERWQPGGKGYQSNNHFWNAIQKYGWDNFVHNIVASDLTFDEACELEISMISQFNTTDPSKGYNVLPGGMCNPDVSPEVRAKISKKLKASRSTPEWHAYMSAKLKGHAVSNETREKISAANKGNSSIGGLHNKGITLTEEQKRNMYGHTSWCKGLTKETDPRVKRISELQAGRKLTPLQREKLSRTQKARFQNGFDPVWVTDGVIEKQIQRNDALPPGYKYGRLNLLNTYIYKGQQSKKISEAALSQYLSAGWQIGRPDSVSKKIQQKVHKLHWEYDGRRFATANELAAYLRTAGYPYIVDSTVTSLYRKGFETSHKYKDLAGKIKRVDHED